MVTKVLLAIFTLTLASQAMAEEAYIRIKDGPKKYMTIKDKNHVEGRLTDLDVDEDDGVILCYAGKTKDVCEIIETAILEENEKEKHDKSHSWKLKICKTSFDKDWWGGDEHIEFKVKRKTGEREGQKLSETISDHMPRCKESIGRRGSNF